MSYSAQLLDHMQKPRNVGYIENADAVGLYENRECGDFVLMTLKVRDGRIADCRFLTRCCSAAVATYSMITEMARGKLLYEAEQISEEVIVEALGGLPPDKLHCALTNHRAIVRKPPAVPAPQMHVGSAQVEGGLQAILGELEPISRWRHSSRQNDQ